MTLEEAKKKIPLGKLMGPYKFVYGGDRINNYPLFVLKIKNSSEGYYYLSNSKESAEWNWNTKLNTSFKYQAGPEQLFEIMDYYEAKT